MSLTITYDGTLSRVRLAGTGLTALAPVAVERSLNGINWTTVRGGLAVTPTSGGNITVDDYEFTPGVSNVYRVVGPALWDQFGRTGSSGWGAAPTGQSWSVTGTASEYSTTGTAARMALVNTNDLHIAHIDVGSSNADFQATVSVAVLPTGAGITPRVGGRYTDTSNYLQAQVLVGTSGAATLQLFRNVGGSGSSVPGTGSVSVGTHAAGNQWTIRLAYDGTAVMARAWNASTGSDPGVWQVTGTDSNVPAGTRLALMGRRETSNSNGSQNLDWTDLVVWSPTDVLFTDSIVPEIDKVWIKSIARPYLNRTVDIRDQSPISRQARAGVFDIVGRTLPVAVSDLRRSKQWTLTLRCETPDEADDVDFVLASGDTLLIQAPATGPLSVVQGGYVTVGTTSRSWAVPFDPLRAIEMQCIEVAAPGPDVVGATGTCQTVLNTYATCADVLAAHPTCADLLELVGSPGDIIVD